MHDRRTDATSDAGRFGNLTDNPDPSEVHFPRARPSLASRLGHKPQRLRGKS